MEPIVFHNAPRTAVPRRAGRIAAALALLAAALVAITAPPADASPPHAIIDNGVVQLGVHAEGHLNVPGGARSSGTGTTFVGLRYLPTGAESTSPGCLCEGWGIWDPLSGAKGFANQALGSGGLVVSAPPMIAPDSVVTEVEAGGTFRVTHDYHPTAATPFLYEVEVTVENITAATAQVVYRRVMDWDIEPTAFSEYVTIQGTPSALTFSSDNGFATADPSVAAGSLLFTGEAVDSGPADHGAVFDFDFGTLDPGETLSFLTYYGAAGNEADADAALAAVAAELYSYGQPNVAGGPDLGRPNTFIFAFAGVGGPPIFGPSVTADLDAVVTDEGTDATNTGTYAGTGEITLSLDGGGPGVLVDNDDGTWSWSNPAPDGPDAYDVTVVATNEDGEEASTTFTVEVRNVTPSVDAGPAQTITFGGTATLDGSFDDPGADAPWDVDVDWGDGDTTATTAAAPGPITESHQYLTLGTHTVEVCVTDKDGATGCDTTTVTVENTTGKVTGGVSTVDGAGKGGFNVMDEEGVVRGNLQYRDASTRFHSNDVTALAVSTDLTSAWFGGVGKDGRTFVAYVEDNGEPNVADVFRLWIDGVLHADDGTMAGGNIQIHR